MVYHRNIARMRNCDFEFTPVIIVGAARSGTNALRDALTELPGFITWNCDEINPIWRHGNLSWPNDEIPAENATPLVRQFVRGEFRKIWQISDKSLFVVEKTCANSLRIPFVDAILPEARYIYIVRSGIDVVASARKRWQGNFEIPRLPYFAAKIRYTPLLDLPYYSWSFLKSRVALLMGKTRRLSVWGPRFTDIANMQSLTLEEICAWQWEACVRGADEAFLQIDPARVLHVRYEDFARRPKDTLLEILSFLEAQAMDCEIEKSVAPVRATSINKGSVLRNELPSSTMDILRARLAAHGYGD